MPTIIQRHLINILSLGFLLFAGCASAPPVLISKSAAVPAGVNLSGTWLLREGAGSMRLTIPGEPGIGPIPIGQQSRSRSAKRSSGTSAQVFLEFGKLLKITQTDHGLFISYDRSVVREYTFGENRLVSVGPIEAMRVSGWEDNTFVAETLDKDGTTLFEHWSLDGVDGVLVRDIRMQDGKEEKFSLTQLFDRK